MQSEAQILNPMYSNPPYTPYNDVAGANSRITSLANGIVSRLNERYWRVKWRCVFNHVDVNNDLSPIDSVDFIGSVWINDEKLRTLQRVTAKMLESTRGNMADLIGRYVINNLAQFIMGNK